MTKDREKRKEWEKTNRVYIGVNLMRSTDGDIIEYIDQRVSEGETKLGTIKRCIRSTMDAEGFTPEGVGKNDC